MGLTALVTVAAAHTGSRLGGAGPTADAIVAGYRWAFLAGNALAILGVLVAMYLVRETGTVSHQAPHVGKDAGHLAGDGI